MLASALQHDASIVKALATSTCLQMGGLAHECNRSETLHEEGHENIWIYACPVIFRHLTCQQESLRLLFIIIITRFSCLEARCVCRRAADIAAKILPLVGLARSKQDTINRGYGAQYLYCPPPAKASG